VAVRSEHKRVVIAVLVTYLVMSFVPQIGLLSLWGGMKGKGKAA
jgi:hypothetical protein